MAFGDVLKKRVGELKYTSKKKSAPDAFWIVLRNIATEEIISIAPAKVDSDIATGVYYTILKENLGSIPQYFQERLPSNKQERFRVINRNMWTSNALHPDGLANQPGIKVSKAINQDRKGRRITYQGGIFYAGK